MEKQLESDAGQVGPPGRDHVAHFYVDDDDLIRAALRHFSRAEPGETVIVIATPEHRRALLAGLNARDGPGQPSVIAVDAAATLNRIMRAGRPVLARFDQIVGDLIERVPGAVPVRVFGEMVGLLWESDRVEAAIELEGMWNRQADRRPISLFCAYPVRVELAHDAGGAVDSVCGLHTGVTGRPHDRDEATRAFASHIEAPRAARRFVTDTLADWGRDQLVPDAAVVTTELATNAVIHARSGFTVSLSWEHEHLRITVGDSSVEPPRYEASSPLAPTGRGLGLVKGIASGWGAEVGAYGKAVWAELGS